jgi:hypothetical protein
MNVELAPSPSAMTAVDWDLGQPALVADSRRSIVDASQFRSVSCVV